MTGRKILLGLGLLFIVVWGLTMLFLAGTLGYALSDANPIIVEDDLAFASHVDRFVNVGGMPNHDLAVVYKRYGIFSYWYPLNEYGNRLIVKSDAPLRRVATSSPQRYSGRLRRVEQVAFSSHVVNRLLETKGLELPAESYVLSIDESPTTFRPLLLMSAPVTFAWLVVVVTVIIAINGGGSRRVS